DRAIGYVAYVADGDRHQVERPGGDAVVSRVCQRCTNPPCHATSAGVIVAHRGWECWDTGWGWGESRSGMRENGNWGGERTVVCRNCGASNPPNAAYCSSCGSPLGGEPEEQVIDVSSGEPRVITPEERGATGWPTYQGWGSERVEQTRVYVARGGRTTCLLI